ncbi:nucleotidyltransferase domain-containing protein [Nocardia farcinica]|uniref:Polymerase nucleotidyl transferase domain-containing protein n=1 Tax=Nocardia farcinica TaxID=37329 RepID=A0A0H5P3K0_NOCFR|nr:nucleotidyltransferase domain-containing protein [Nocardia farcinica]AXK87681.1 hypothetical protein DXT66_20445 [Nocardia farcinica]MBA4856790.1 nucleotidyltransferase domain-containing protein [Nocardia farcinica]MBC9818934.1 nucleotidyltransferase domain-containing protein [Nocardia farcinica]MBF6071982.1 nucleotidyltransferase domain-containing protein [Nocardia farcinica]MBF6259328.1 nucleotidyltransferase domain-containing protein [Nocardia farcinica]
MTGELFAEAAAITAEFAPDGYGLAYGSHASGLAGPNSDLDLVLIGRHRPESERMSTLISRVVSLHHAFGLDLDTEVDYRTKLFATHEDVNAAVELRCFDQVDGRFAPSPVIVEPWWLNSTEFGRRLLLNALTSEHIFLGGDVQRYRFDRQRAEHGIARLAVSMIVNPSLTIADAVEALSRSSVGACGKDFLGYTSSSYLHSAVAAGVSALVRAGDLEVLPGLRVRATARSHRTTPHVCTGP